MGFDDEKNGFAVGHRVGGQKERSPEVHSRLRAGQHEISPATVADVNNNEVDVGRHLQARLSGEKGADSSAARGISASNVVRMAATSLTVVLLLTSHVAAAVSVDSGEDFFFFFPIQVVFVSHFDVKSRKNFPHRKNSSSRNSGACECQCERNLARWPPPPGCRCWCWCRCR